MTHLSVHDQMRQAIQEGSDEALREALANGPDLSQVYTTPDGMVDTNYLRECAYHGYQDGAEIIILHAVSNGIVLDVGVRELCPMVMAGKEAAFDALTQNRLLADHEAEACIVSASMLCEQGRFGQWVERILSAREGSEPLIFHPYVAVGVLNNALNVDEHYQGLLNENIASGFEQLISMGAFARMASMCFESEELVNLMWTLDNGLRFSCLSDPSTLRYIDRMGLEWGAFAMACRSHGYENVAQWASQAQHHLLAADVASTVKPARGPRL